MRIFIFGVCGTFMSGIALLAKEAGHEVIGFDEAFYAPMSDQLRAVNIPLYEGYYTSFLPSNPDLIIVGNVVKRGNVLVEWMLDKKIPYMSGPEWLYRECLAKQKYVFAVAGTHGKTTTASMLAWILEKAGKQPGFLIGGIPQNFGKSARQGNGEYFVVEADEYDTAFFDKRSKFVHYHPDTLIINNLEYDHADIFPDLAAIQKQFHYMIRMIPQKGVIIRPAQSKAIDDTLAMGCWSHVKTFSTNVAIEADWHAVCTEDGFSVKETRVQWSLLGEHNVSNALAAIAASHVPPETACAALETFHNVKRRLEIRGVLNHITVYDDFAHHPTAIQTTIAGLRAHVHQERIIAVLHLGSNSMRMGIYNDTLEPALQAADIVIVLKPEKPEALNWIKTNEKSIIIQDSVDDIVAFLAKTMKPHDHILVMSNGSFGDIHEKILTIIKTREYHS